MLSCWINRMVNFTCTGHVPCKCYCNGTRMALFGIPVVICPITTMSGLTQLLLMLRKETCPSAIFLPQFRHGVAWNRTRRFDCELKSVFTFNKDIQHCIATSVVRHFIYLKYRKIVYYIYSCGTSSRFRVMAFTDGASRSHSLDTLHSVELLWRVISPTQKPLPDNT
jgi:hypothetical protein